MADRSDIDEVRQRVGIVSVVEKYVTLKRAGRGLVGLCPFHQEKTPSFHVNPDLGFWKCFGQCAEGGDVFKFVQKIENLSFPEALERLAIQAGVTLAERPRPATGAEQSAPRSGADERERIYAVNALALRYFREMLVKTPPARRYLEARGIANDAASAFALGFAPDLWDGLTKFLIQNRVALADAERAGLLSQNERGYFDKMRGRLVFPIFDVQERPVAFGGRLLGEAGPGAPKYWNSPETPVFSKSRTLYGLEKARKAIAERGSAIVVEGYTDVVAAHQAGFENVVATLGTSLTEEHVKVLARLAPRVLLAFDADSAGLKAAFRAAAIFEEQEVDVRVLDLPEGEDPDSLLRANKRAVFERAIEGARALTEYRVERLIRTAETQTDDGRLALFKKALPLLAAVPTAMEREIYIKRLAVFHPQFSTGAAYAEEQIRHDAANYHAGRAMPQPAPMTAPRPAAQAMPSSAPRTAERQLLRALTGQDVILAEHVLTSLTPDEYWTDTGRALAKRLYAAYVTDYEPDIVHLAATLESEDSALGQALVDIFMDTGELPLSAAVIDDAIACLKKREEAQALSVLAEKIKSGTAGAAEMQEYLRRQKERKGMTRAA